MQQNCLVTGQTRSPNSFLCAFSDLLAVYKFGRFSAKAGDLDWGTRTMYVVEEREGKRKENIRGKIG